MLKVSRILEGFGHSHLRDSIARARPQYLRAADARPLDQTEIAVVKGRAVNSRLEPALRRPIIAGARVRHILGAEGICTGAHGLQCHPLHEQGGVP